MHSVAEGVGVRLDFEMKAIVQHACGMEAAFALAEMERLNTEALAALVGQHGVKLRMFPESLVVAARGQAKDVLGEIAAKGTTARKVHDSYMSFRERTGAWSRDLHPGGAGGAGRLKRSGMPTYAGIR